MRLLSGLLLFAFSLSAQVNFTPASSTGPAVLTLIDATSTGPTISCTVTGNAHPAERLFFSCTIDNTTVGYNLPIDVGGTSISWNMANGGNIVGAIFTRVGSKTGISFRASVHGSGTVTTGTF